MKKKISILGSTGSIGLQALQVIRKFPRRFSVVGLAADSSWKTLAQQIDDFKPVEVGLHNEEAALNLSRKLDGSGPRVWSGEESLSRIASIEQCDMVLIAVVGMAGLLPTIKAIESGHDIALATKEALVTGGELVMREALSRKVKILPVDSEHSAVFQCLRKEKRKAVRRLILTSSGGPFRALSKAQMECVTVDAALEHPTWKMGKKITIDSATLMNKGFEVLEAHHLFSIPLDAIEVVIHPESIIHSLVEFCDGSTLAQLSPPDMRLPIQYALGYPERLPQCWNPIDLAEIGKMTFAAPDIERFPCLSLAYKAGAAGGTMPCVMNAANEVAVARFLKGEIPFTAIPAIIESVMNEHHPGREVTLQALQDADRWARKRSENLVLKYKISC